MKYVFDKRLPKANLLRIRIIKPLNGCRWFIKMRGANFMDIYVGRINATLRMPWLRSSAVALHPELFPKP